MEKTVSASQKIGAQARQRCINQSCGGAYELTDRLYVCSRCGGPLEIEAPLGAARGDAAALREAWRLRGASPDPKDRSGVWRYREFLPFDPAVAVTLFEGNTPLYDAPRCAEYCGIDALRLKHQGCNPTGSFKDTGMTVAVTHAAMLGVQTTICASTGNTAASLAAYSARARFACAILVPYGQISSAKLAQSMDYGASILEVEGNFDDCMRLVQELGDDPSIYVANSINPFRIEGQKTVAIELTEQCAWRVPDHVMVPGGNLGNSSALGKGFGELRELGLIDRIPKLYVIQAEGSAPFVRMFADLKAAAARPGRRPPETMVTERHPRTLATAIKIGAPVSWKKSLRAVLESGGKVIAVTEQEIADAKAVIGREGIGCEPASATTVAGIRRLVAENEIRRDENVIAVLTGHLLKDPEYVSNYHRGTLTLPADHDGIRKEERIEGAFQNRPERVSASKPAILKRLESRKA
ncbi:MAG TPA: threonine synthase [Candidatus Acidoferrales bacterium]|nr:threonine synthase [Candidatus Acidoferrales bacterium]